MDGTGGLGDRGQILLISSLLIAVLFVGLAVVVNSAIYTENRATREVTRSSAPIADHPVTKARLGQSVQTANFHSDSDRYDERYDVVQENVTSWNDEMQDQAAQNGALWGSEVSRKNNGTRISQNQHGVFMPNDPDIITSMMGVRLDPFGITDRTSWLVGPDVQTRHFNVTAERESLYKVDGDLLDEFTNLLNALVTGSTTFWVHFDDGTTVWKVYLVQVEDTNEVATIVTEEDGLGETVQGTCRVQGSNVSARLHRNELVSDDKRVSCPAMSFTEDLDRQDIYFAGADEIQGTYDIIADRKETPLREDVEDRYDDVIGDLLSGLSCVTNPLCLFEDPDTSSVLADGASNGDPYTTPAIWNTTVQLTYQDQRVEYSRNVSVPANS